MGEVFVLQYDKLAATLASLPGGAVAVQVLLIVWLVVLFYWLFTVSDGHFVTALAHLANILRLSPDIAGLTLLALGNGAPDFFTGVFAGDGQLDMVVGASVGSGLFIMTAVFGSVIWFFQPPKVHTDGIIAASKEVESWREPSATDKQHCPQLPRRHVLRASLVYLASLMLLSGILYTQRAPLWFCGAMPVLYVCYIGATLVEYFAKRRTTVRKTSIIDIFDVEEFQELAPIAKIRAIIEWPQSGTAHVWTRRVWCIVGAALRMPFAVSILPMEYSGEDMDIGAQLFINRIRCGISPIFAVPLFLFLTIDDHMSSYKHWVIAGALSLVLSALLVFTTRRTSRPALFPIHVAIAFALCIVWIYALCRELVCALSFAAEKWNVQPSVIGALALGLGNSFGDLVSNTTVSREGNFEAAVSSVFSSPIQNMLLTLGTVLAIVAHKSEDHVALVIAKRTIVVPLVLLLAVIVFMVPAIVFFFNCRIPRTFGLFLMGTYVVYVPLAVYLAVQSA